MLRRSSSVEQVLTYATFLAISIAIHMLVILGSGQERHPGGAPAAPASTARGVPR